MSEFLDDDVCVGSKEDRVMFNSPTELRDECESFSINWVRIFKCHSVYLDDMFDNNVFVIIFLLAFSAYRQSRLHMQAGFFVHVYTPSKAGFAGYANTPSNEAEDGMAVSVWSVSTGSVTISRTGIYLYNNRRHVGAGFAVYAVHAYTPASTPTANEAIDCSIHMELQPWKRGNQSDLCLLYCMA